MEKKYLSFDIGGTNVKWGLLDEEGNIINKGYFSSGNGCGDTVLAGMRDKITAHQHEAKGIAISAPGFIHPDTGYIEMGGAITDFDNLNLQTLLETEFDLPVSVENDVNCVALAEKWLGNAKNLTDFVCMTIGTGIGGSLFLNNDLYRGHAFRGGEFGFMITGGLHTNNPEHDSLSITASMTSVREKYAVYHNTPVEEVTGEIVFDAYDKNDPVARQIVENFYQTLAIGIYNIVSVLNPEKVLLGGGITGRPTFIEELENHIKYVDRVFQLEIDECYFKNDAGLVGALAFHKTKPSRAINSKNDNSGVSL